MAAFISVPPFPGATPEAQMARPALKLTRYCRTTNCRNAVRPCSEDKLCEQCLGSKCLDPPKNAIEYGEPSSGLLRVSSNDTKLPTDENREDRDWQPARHTFGQVAVEAQASAYAAHLTMLDERQQNRARKLERTTEEVDGRWRTISSATAFLDSSSSHSVHARKSELNRGVTVDDYRPGDLTQPREIDAYRPDDLVRQPELDAYRSDRSPRSSTEVLGSTHLDRLFEKNLHQAQEPVSNLNTSVPLGPSMKRKSEGSYATFTGSFTSNKSLGSPSQSARCGKRQCNNIALAGKDRCQSCYTAEGRHPGVSALLYGNVDFQTEAGR